VLTTFSQSHLIFTPLLNLFDSKSGVLDIFSQNNNSLIAVMTDIVKIVVLLKDISYMGCPDYEYSSLRQSNPYHATNYAFATCVAKKYSTKSARKGTQSYEIYAK